MESGNEFLWQPSLSWMVRHSRGSRTCLRLCRLRATRRVRQSTLARRMAENPGAVGLAHSTHRGIVARPRQTRSVVGRVKESEMLVDCTEAVTVERNSL